MVSHFLTDLGGTHVATHLGGSRRAVDETHERLLSLICQKGLRGGGRDEDDCYWALLAESSTDRFVILEGIHKSRLTDARNDEFQLVAVGSAATENACLVLWPGAKDLACVVHKIMTNNRNQVKNSEIAERGLPIYQLEEDGEMRMLSRVLKPPSVLGAVASPSLLAQGALDDTASISSAPSAVVSLGTDSNHSEAAEPAELPELVMYSSSGTRIYCFSIGHLIRSQRYTYTSGDNTNMIITTTGDGNNTGGHSHRNLWQELVVAAPPLAFTRSSGGRRGRNGGSVVVPAAAVEFLVRRWCPDYDLEAQRHLDYDLEATGGRGHAHQAAHHPAATAAAFASAAAPEGARRGACRAAAPVQEPSGVAKLLQGIMVQAYAALLPACVTAYPLLKDAPDHVKFTVFGGLAFTTVGLFVGILSKSAARRGLAIRLVSFSAIAVLAFSVASQLSSPTYIALTALVAVAINLIVMLLPF